MSGVNRKELEEALQAADPYMSDLRVKSIASKSVAQLRFEIDKRPDSTAPIVVAMKLALKMHEENEVQTTIAEDVRIKQDAANLVGNWALRIAVAGVIVVLLLAIIFRD